MKTYTLYDIWNTPVKTGTFEELCFFATVNGLREGTIR
jgi:hypothetical protein